MILSPSEPLISSLSLFLSVTVTSLASFDKLWVEKGFDDTSSFSSLRWDGLSIMTSAFLIHDGFLFIKLVLESVLFKLSTCALLVAFLTFCRLNCYIFTRGCWMTLLSCSGFYFDVSEAFRALRVSYLFDLKLVCSKFFLVTINGLCSASCIKLMSKFKSPEFLLFCCKKWGKNWLVLSKF